ncbi:MAG: lipid IV(A) 3-deoxy-D-manno-octulosonic acid transferase [Aestuariibacter sp.]
MQTSKINTAKQIPNDRLVRICYSCLLLLILPLFLLFLFSKAEKRSSGFFARIKERFGILPKPTKTGGVLFHCVSVGEVTAATPVVKYIQQNLPEIAITITTTTPTGSAQVVQTFSDTVNHCYLPFDFPVFVNQLLAIYQPEKLVITEVELWPNLIHACHKKHIKTFILNARLTDKSAKSYGKLASLIKPMLLKIDGICAQSKRDLENYQKLCPNLQSLHLTGNLKFDQKLQPQERQLTAQLRSELFAEQRPVIIAASTHEPEEESLIEACKSIWQTYPEVLLLLVPRHPQRFETVRNICREHRLSVQMLSDNEPISANTQVLIADKMGMLKSLYGLADMAFVGGSIANKGGHNALEAALHSIPVIMGPNIYNNPGICDALQQAGALKVVPDSSEMTTVFRCWLHDKTLAQRAGQSGHQVISQNAGALQKQLSVLEINGAL